MNIRPTGDRVLVLREELSDKSAGGILLPADQNDSPVRYGKVLGIGPGKEFDLPFVVDDRVMFGRYAGIDLGNDQVMLREDEVLATIED